MNIELFKKNGDLNKSGSPKFNGAFVLNIVEMMSKIVEK